MALQLAHGIHSYVCELIEGPESEHFKQLKIRRIPQIIISAKYFMV